MIIKERIDTINNIIKYLKKEREFIRTEICKHPKFKIKNWSDYPGHAYPAKICTTCGENLGHEDLF